MKLLNRNIIFKYTEHLWVFVIWMVVISLPVVILRNQGYADWIQIFNIWKRLLPFIALFLVNHYLLVPFLFFNKKRKAYYLVSVILVLMLTANEFLKPKPSNMMRPPLGLQHDLKGHSPKPNNAPLSPSGRGLDTKNPNRRPPLQHPPGQFPPYVSVFLVSALILGFDTGIKASMKWTEREKQLALLENESVQNQLAFLKNQISPHFFMNTLNNIHALIDIDTEEAKESIIKLSKLMRYLLYESEEGKVPLVKEFEFINSYVNLMKLRFSEKVKIDLNFSEKIPDKLIPPMLFTSLIENAFKHGISYKEESFIQIDFLTTESRIVFEIRNKKTETANDSKHSGIGIENTKKRLDLLYGNNYQMDIIENNDDFMVNLTIPII